MANLRQVRVAAARRQRESVAGTSRNLCQARKARYKIGSESAKLQVSRLRLSKRPGPRSGKEKQAPEATSKKSRSRQIMAMKCELCGKGPHYGNVVSHANNKRRRRWNPNLRRMHALVGGVRKHLRVCTACIRAGRVKKAA